MEGTLTKPKIREERELDLSKFLILEGRSGSYPDLFIDKYPTLYGKDWEDSHNALTQMDPTLFMIPTLPFIDLYRNLLLERTLFNGLGNRLKPKGNEYNQIRNHMLNQTWEWLNARFSSKGGKSVYITSPRLTSGRLEEATEELEIYNHINHITEDCYVDILDFDKQGMPTRKSRIQEYSKMENIYFRHPRNGTVAWFGAYSDWAGLCCDRDPRSSYSWLGVRGAKIKGE